uniref:Uncharacterized protein n=1 Tax=Arundo donax TaxID=35708 RepID=A0A0A8XNL1_ARUDO
MPLVSVRLCHRRHRGLLSLLRLPLLPHNHRPLLTIPIRIVSIGAPPLSAPPLRCPAPQGHRRPQTWSPRPCWQQIWPPRPRLARGRGRLRHGTPMCSPTSVAAARPARRSRCTQRLVYGGGSRNRMGFASMEASQAPLARRPKPEPRCHSRHPAVAALPPLSAKLQLAFLPEVPPLSASWPCSTDPEPHVVPR